MEKTDQIQFPTFLEDIFYWRNISLRSLCHYLLSYLFFNETHEYIFFKNLYSACDTDDAS